MYIIFHLYPSEICLDNISPLQMQPELLHQAQDQQKYELILFTFCL